jgi:lipopolysaccharide biosynthesis glycosyltransferase
MTIKHRDEIGCSPPLGKAGDIEILCASGERYLPHMATMLCSLLEHNPVYRIHYLHSFIPSSELQKLRNLTESYNCELACYDMRGEDFSGLRAVRSWAGGGGAEFSATAYFRLFASRILPSDLEKVLYLDADVIVRRSLKDLWCTDINGYALAAIEDAFWTPASALDFIQIPEGARYFNSGVLLLNLKYWRQNAVSERAIKFIKENPAKVNFHDQDALNVLLIDRWINLPATWNDMARSTSPVPAVRNRNVVDPAIVHFVGDAKPWRWSSKHPFKREYHVYRLKTPWWQYRQEGRPTLFTLWQSFEHGLRRFVGNILPRHLRESLRRLVSSKIYSRPPGEIEIFCACDERYLPHAATMLCSLLEHNRVSRIHFLYSSIAEAELSKLTGFAAKYHTPITFYDMFSAKLQNLPVKWYLSEAIYYRIIAPRLLPTDLDKILYLDSDIIVRQSLNKLWETKLAHHALAAVVDEEEAPTVLGFPPGTKYFNAGVLLINLRYWRQHNVPERAIAFIKNNPDKVPYLDQDALNAILVDHWIELPGLWNAQTDAYWTGTDPAIVHFFSARKPWQWSCKHPFKHEYHKYRAKTPWRRYKQDGQPSRLRRVGQSLRHFIRIVLPAPLRQWLRSRIMMST